MKKLIIKSKDRIWPTVVWQGSRIITFFLGEEEDKNEVRETAGIDFEEFFLHLDRGGSIFVTLRDDPICILEKTDHNEPLNTIDNRLGAESL